MKEITNSDSSKFLLPYIFPGDTYVFGKHCRHFHVLTMNKVVCDAYNRIIDFSFIKKHRSTAEISQQSGYIPIIIATHNTMSELAKKKYTPLILYKRYQIRSNKLKNAKYYI